MSISTQSGKSTHFVTKGCGRRFYLPLILRFFSGGGPAADGGLADPVAGGDSLPRVAVAAKALDPSVATLRGPEQDGDGEQDDRQCEGGDGDEAGHWIDSVVVVAD